MPLNTTKEILIRSSPKMVGRFFMLLVLVSPCHCSSGAAPKSRQALLGALDQCFASKVKNTEPMSAVVRQSGGMVFHAQADFKYYPRAPKRGTDEVMLSVRAASINPADYKAGSLILGPIVGIDVAGVVTEVAQDSTSPFKVGDEVYGTCRGSLANRVLVSSASLGHKPRSLSFVQAAAMPTTYVTSLQALRDHGKLSRDGRVLVIGASGGCGIAGLQLAQYMGASEVVAVSSAKNRDLVLQEGATAHIDYNTTNFADRCGASASDNERFDVVYDCASGSGGGENYRTSAVACLRGADAEVGRKHGQYVAISGGASMWLRMFTIGQKKNENLLISKPNTKDLNLLASLVDVGWSDTVHKLHPVVMKVLPLTSQAMVDEGFAILRSRRATGKIVFKLWPNADVVKG